jgi:hypothetical protein
MPGGAHPVAGRRLLLVALGAALAGALFALSFVYADHSPTPHDVHVAIVAPPRTVTAVARGLQHALPGGFVVTRAASAPAARTALRQQQIRGALVLPAGGQATVLIAGAAGTSLAQVVETALTGAARAGGRSARSLDVVPLPAADRAGTTAYLLEIGMLLPSVLGSIGLYLVGIGSRLWWRTAAAALFAVIVGGLGALVAFPLVGALTGPWCAAWGILTLGALAFVLTVAAAQATFGLPATGLFAVALIFVGNAISGGAVPTGLLPVVYRQLSPLTPNAGIVHGIKAVVYFGGHGAGTPLLVLALWTGAALWVLTVNDLLHSAAGRNLSAQAQAEVYATPGVVHASRLLGGSRSVTVARPDRDPAGT